MEYQFNKDYFKNILNIINSDVVSNSVYPSPENILETFKYFDLDDVKVVFIFQDPYIGEEIINDRIIPQAMGY
jgi:uracil DNA glycosylase